MAFQDFPETLYFKTVDTSEKVNLMNFTPGSDNQLKHGRVMLYIAGAVTTEQVRLNVNPSETNGNPIFSSDWSDLSDITTHTGTDWIGWLRFDFSEKHLDSDVTYTMQLETNNYTRNGDTTYLAVAYDWPYPVNDQDNDNRPSIGVELYGLE
jgi:hypothetical protein